ncbi:MAG: patatin-like phospholipase family protein, partial [Gammaproteobacteria bacterium]|nr:patatin-like phospholipase family protein [Gammaproteobacteria bacterium]
MSHTLFDKNLKCSLVLSGGGMRLSYQAGALLALQEQGLRFSHIDATSGGSINLSMLLSEQTPAAMCERWISLDVMKSVSLLPLSRYVEMETLDAMGDADGMRDYVFPHLGIDISRMISNQDVVGTYNVLNYGKKKLEVFGHQDMDEDLLVAGMSLPGVFPPVKKNQQVYLDAAFVQDANLMEAVKRGAEEIWLIWGLGNTDVYKGGALNIYVQMLEMSANGALNNEIQQILEINQNIMQGKSLYGQSSPIKLHIIFPKQALPLDPELYLGKISNR